MGWGSGPTGQAYLLRPPPHRPCTGHLPTVLHLSVLLWPGGPSCWLNLALSRHQLGVGGEVLPGPPCQDPSLAMAVSPLHPKTAPM